jgi:acetyl esterase
VVSLDPQVVSYLDQLKELGVRPPSDLPIEEARQAYDEGAVARFGSVPIVAVVEDADAAGVPVRVYRPASGKLPGIVYCHGGGWVLGSLSSHDPLCRALAVQSGCAVIAVDYRLAPEHPYPAALEDVWAATIWAATQFAPLAVAADSAGGQLAAALALRARAAALPLALQALIYPVTNYSFDTPSYLENFGEMTLTADLMRWFWRQYVQDERQAEDPGCSPLRASDLAGLPRAHVLTAEYDPLRDEGEEYARSLRDSGVPVTLNRYEGQIHGFIRMPALIDKARDAIAEISSAIRAAMSVGLPSRADERRPSQSSASR